MVNVPLELPPFPPNPAIGVPTLLMVPPTPVLLSPAPPPEAPFLPLSFVPESFPPRPPPPPPGAV